MRAQLGRFGFSRERADLKVGVMSGGEKTRLLLALATRNAPHLLLLDEPTNHLDMDARASLVDAINDFDGAVVLVSHDTHLVKMVADQLWVVAGGAVKPFDGDIDDYQAQAAARAQRPAGQGAEAPRRRRSEAKPAPVAAVRGGRQAQARPSQARHREGREEDGRPQQAARRDRGQARRSRDYSGPPTVVADLQKEKLRLERELAHAEHDWLVAQEAYEAA